MRHRDSNVCWAAACTFRKIGRMIRRAEKKLRSRRGAVSHEAADRPGTHRPGFGQRSSRGGLDVRRAVRSRWQVSRRPGATTADVRGRDSHGFPRLGAEAPDSAFWAEKEQETGPRQRVSAVGPSPSFLRSPQFGDVLSAVSRAVVAAIPHQGHGQGAGGLGSEVGRVLAERRGRFARPPALPDRGPQRADAGSEILSLPTAYRAKRGSACGGCYGWPSVAGRWSVAFVSPRTNWGWITIRSAGGVACTGIST